MKVVLLADVRKVGKKYDVVEVSNGHALNLLIPQKKAILATEGKIKWAVEAKKNNVTEKEVQANLLEMNVESIKSAVVTMTEKVNDKGHLFAGIHKDELLKALLEQTKIAIDPDFVLMDKPIKEVGEHMIPVVSGKVKTEFKLVVVAM